MEKTKLGISVGLLGAALYFLGLLNSLPLIILAGYVLLFEQNVWLRKSAVKVVAILLVFNVLSSIVGVSNDIFDILNAPLSWLRISFRLSWPLNVDTIVLNILNIAKTLLLMLLGFRALSQGTFSVGIIDNVIDKNI